MDVAGVKIAPKLALRVNPYFNQVDIPWLYQKRAALIMFARPRMILGDDVGLGKTLESVVGFSYMKARDPDLRAIVFTEKSALIQWKKEIEWLCPTLRVAVITAETHPDPAKRRLALRDKRYDVKISTYYTVYGYLEDIRAGLGEKYAVFADECNYFKNSGTKMFVQMKSLCDTATRAYGMSATVIENRLEEAYCILRVIAPGTIPSRSYFDKAFCVKKTRVVQSLDPLVKTKKVAAVVGYKNIPRFREIIEPVFYGRLQTDPEVEQDLPEDIHKDIPIMMSKAQSKKYLEAENGLLKTAQEEYVQLGVLSSLTICQQLANSPSLKGFEIPSAKEEALIENLTNSLAGEKVVVFSKFRTQIDRIETLLNAAGIRIGRITGKEDGDQREAARMSFQSNEPGSVEVLLITKAGQKALNLQNGGHLIMFDMPWSYGMYRQLVGRLKRTGSTKTHVGVYRYLSEIHPEEAQGSTIETIDHHVLRTLFRKKDLFNAVLGDTTTIETSDQDLMGVYKEILKARGITNARSLSE